MLLGKNKTKVTLELCLEIIKQNITNFKCLSKEKEQQLITIINENIHIDVKTFKTTIKNIFNKKDDKILSSIHKEYWMNRGYSEEETLFKISHEQKTRSKRSIEFWLKNGYTEEEAKLKVSEHQKILSKRHKDKLSEKEYYEHNRKNSVWCKEFWLRKGYTEEEATKEISKYQSENTKKIDYSKRITWVNIEYWIDRGYTEEEAKDIISLKSSVTSLESYIKRYGMQLGIHLYEDRLDEFKRTVNDWPEDKKDEINKRRSIAMKRYLQSRPFQKQSKQGKKFCKKLYKELLRNDIIKHKQDFLCYVNGEKYLKFEDYRFFFDVCVNDQYLIEYHGTPWHYDDEVKEHIDWFWSKGHYFPNITKDNVALKDLKRKECAIHHNYKYLVVWDFQDMEKEIKNIIRIIKDDRKSNHI